VRLDETFLVLGTVGATIEVLGYRSLARIPGALPALKTGHAESRFLVICVVPFLIRVAQLTPESLPDKMPVLRLPLAAWCAPLLAAAALAAPFFVQCQRRSIGSPHRPLLLAIAAAAIVFLGVSFSPFHEADLRRELDAHQASCDRTFADLLQDPRVAGEAREALERERVDAAVAARAEFTLRGVAAARTTLHARRAGIAHAADALLQSKRRLEEQERDLRRRERERAAAEQRAMEARLGVSYRD
jgi:hypothetical protein